MHLFSELFDKVDALVLKPWREKAVFVHIFIVVVVPIPFLLILLENTFVDF